MNEKSSMDKPPIESDNTETEIQPARPAKEWLGFMESYVGSDVVAAHTPQEKAKYKREVEIYAAIGRFLRSNPVLDAKLQETISDELIGPFRDSEGVGGSDYRFAEFAMNIAAYLHSLPDKNNE